MNTRERLRELLETKGWTAYRLAKEAKLSESTIINIFNRDATPSIPTLEAICNGFGITLSQFFAENELVELNDELKELFDGWVFLSTDQKAAILKLIDAINKEKEE